MSDGRRSLARNKDERKNNDEDEDNEEGDPHDRAERGEQQTNRWSLFMPTSLNNQVSEIFKVEATKMNNNNNGPTRSR